MAVTGADVKIIIAGDTAPLSRALASANTHVNVFEKQNTKALRVVEKNFARMGGVAGKFGSIYGGILGAVAIGATAAFAKSSVKAFLEVDEAFFRTSSRFAENADVMIQKQKDMKEQVSEFKFAWKEMSVAVGSSGVWKAIVGTATAAIGGDLTGVRAEESGRAEFESARAAIPQLMELEKQLVQVRTEGIPNIEEYAQMLVREDELKSLIAKAEPALLSATEARISADAKLTTTATGAAQAVSAAAMAMATLSSGASGRAGVLTSGPGVASGVKAGRSEEISAFSGKGKMVVTTPGGTGTKVDFGKSGVTRKNDASMLLAGGQVFEFSPRDNISLNASDKGGGGGNTISINVNGAGMDPHRLAIEIKRELATLI